MDAAKNAVKSFIHKDGKHDTTVHEKVNPAVTNETVTRQQEDRITTAVDKEVHQDHYHTSVQPVKDTQVLPEKHHHNLAGVEHRNFEHDDASQVKQKLAAEQARFKDTSTRVEGEHRTTTQPVVAGEHVHHHVHEQIQPVVNKQTIEPHVVHTTVPIHEVHHNASQHHSTTALPAMSMSEFKANGGSLTGREERTDAFDGCPKPGHASTAGTGNSIATHDHHHHNGAAGAGAALAGSRAAGHSAGSTGATVNNSAGSTLTGQRQHDVEPHLTGNHNGISSTEHKKPSLMDRLNPKKDADGDGKAGLMD
ncbi:hypothetical protein CERZMDRAFT_91959 [Cercospora zeae-maydis SCOH1-5]|uniref:Allergen n=1 Tax=Cercospora zeae-maydis SCOH1-5 TaxID=717836 RepID=A0A6A6EZE0_9PEZI|nr:hypothetical protein CERZMDRAFT_91959 [Cercospora zeae-maydis SCOH1-5]